jgi:hypothetical protein
MRFDDYHRTVVGYHGTKLSTALEIVSRRRGFKRSENRDDWLGHGVYFWEYAPQQAFWWAQRRQKRQKWEEPIAILAAMIRLGFCFDLLDPYNVKYLRSIHDEYVKLERLAGRKPPENANNHKFLDCAVFQYAYAAIESSGPDLRVDSARAVYVPKGKGTRVWKRSWISYDTHIQICVRNPACILGAWLHHPTQLEISDDRQTNQASSFGFESENQTSREGIEEATDHGSSAAPGEGEADDAERG